ncbi:DNA adenine methylase [Sulfurimonas sp.]
MWKSFRKWSNRLKYVTIENMKFEELIKKYDKEDSFFYLDPPYYNFENYYA